ncbi:hypothetical protein SAMN03159288_04649 [Rhizobium sp. NFACC06-2]|nr:hypothetical protein SAMN03159288_04649 [Rhizobium sp. NFACC06-2]
MRFAALKSEEQADLQALHRVRDQMIGTRTRLINQMRAFCLEYGIALRQGAGLFKLDLPQALEDHSNDLSSAMRKLLADLFAAPIGTAHWRHHTRDRGDRQSRGCRTTAHDDPWDWGVGRNCASGCRWKRPTIPESSRSGSVAWPSATGILDRRKAEASRHQQAGKPLCSQASRT